MIRLVSTLWVRMSPAWLRSLRVRLQLWYGCLMLAVLGSFGGLLYVRAAGETNRQIDDRLEAALMVLDVELRAFPPQELGNQPPDKKQRPAPPGKKRREDFLAELELPRDFAGRGGYFAAWQKDGTLIKATGFGADIVTATDPGGADLSARPLILSRGPYREAWMEGPQESRIVVGVSISDDMRRLHAFGLSILGIGLAIVALGMAVGWLIANRMVRPIKKMSTAAATVSGENLSQRIDVRHLDAELAELADVLNAMFIRLEAAFVRQQQFTADASHELRTPLAIIMSQTELSLSKPRTPDEYRGALQSCQRAAERMNNLVKGLLSLARADVGKSLSLHQINLHDVVTDCVSQLRPLALTKQVTLTASVSPIATAGNAERLGQVILNLVNNAIAFNKPGGEVEVRLIADGSFAVLTVRDTGIGIPQHHQAKIFQRFFRVDKSRSRAVGGTGLGLAICKTFIEAHQGTIDFQSKEGTGTTFRVRLPIRNAIETRIQTRER